MKNVIITAGSVLYLFVVVMTLIGIPLKIFNVLNITWIQLFLPFIVLSIVSGIFVIYSFISGMNKILKDKTKKR